MEHFEYCVDLVGIDQSRSDRTRSSATTSASTAVRRAPRRAATSASTTARPEYVEGLENIGEFPNIVRWLVKHGYGDEDIAKAIGGNTLRALREVWI